MALCEQWGPQALSCNSYYHEFTILSSRPARLPLHMLTHAHTPVQYYCNGGYVLCLEITLFGTGQACEVTTHTGKELVLVLFTRRNLVHSQCIHLSSVKTLARWTAKEPKILTNQSI